MDRESDELPFENSDYQINLQDPDQGIVSKRARKSRRKYNKHLPVAAYITDTDESYWILANEQGSVPVKVTCHSIAMVEGTDPNDVSGKPSFVPEKYWNQRYALFSRFDEGVLMDEESWYSVTHEAIAKVIADACGSLPFILDGFAGVGGNAIQFAQHSHVIAIELDNKRSQYLRHNAKVYGVGSKIKVVHGDFFEKAPELGFVDAAFLSPPWGGPGYMDSKVFNMMNMLNPDLGDTLKTCELITRTVFLYMPRNIDPKELLDLFLYVPSLPRKAEIQLYFFGNKVKTIGIMMGEAVKMDSVLLAEAAIAQKIGSKMISRLWGEFSGNEFLVKIALANLMETEGIEAALAL